MEFKDLNLASGIRALNEHMTGRSYITGVEPTQNDLIVFRAMSADCVKEKESINVKRWYMHIKSFTNDEMKAFPVAKEKIKVILPPVCEVKFTLTYGSFLIVSVCVLFFSLNGLSVSSMATAPSITWSCYPVERLVEYNTI